MINCLRPSNRSSRLILPRGPSNSYFFSTATQGIRRRSAASASRERVKAFSLTRSWWRTASHSRCDTIGGVFICILFLLPYRNKLRRFALFLWRTTDLCSPVVRSEKSSEPADAHRENSSRGSGSGNHYCCVCEAYRAHVSLLWTVLTIILANPPRHA